MLKKKKGFNVVQLLVVMLIIAVLVVLALPHYLGYTEKANITRLKNDLRVIEDACERYYLNNDAWPRLGAENAIPICTSNSLPEDFRDRFLVSVKSDEANDVDRYFFERLDGNYTCPITGKVYPKINLYELDWNRIKSYLRSDIEYHNVVLRNTAGRVYIGDFDWLVPSEMEEELVEPEPEPEPVIEELSILDAVAGTVILDPYSNFQWRYGVGYTGSVERVEPVEWVIVAKNHFVGNSILLTSKTSVASCRFHNVQSTQYRTSDIRKFLNDTFSAHFSSQLNGVLLTPTIPLIEWKNPTLGFVEGTLTGQKAILLSQIEYNIGTLAAAYCSTEKEIPYFTAANRIIFNVSGSSQENYYYTRTPKDTISAPNQFMRMVSSGGAVDHDTNLTVGRGVRASITIKNNVTLYGPDGEGRYHMFTPDFITF